MACHVPVLEFKLIVTGAPSSTAYATFEAPVALATTSMAPPYVWLLCGSSIVTVGSAPDEATRDLVNAWLAETSVGCAGGNTALNTRLTNASASARLH